MLRSTTLTVIAVLMIASDEGLSSQEFDASPELPTFFDSPSITPTGLWPSAQEPLFPPEIQLGAAKWFPESEQDSTSAVAESSIGTNSQTAQWDVGGWLATGYHNRSLPLSRSRGEGRSFNDVPGSVNVNQFWLYLSREPNRESLDWGFRGDLVYGTDAQKTQAFGGTGWDNSLDNGVYGWALPQLYLEVANERWDVKIGHFFTLVGYEVVTSTDNFFYSRSLTMFNSEPFTHSGVLATYDANEKLSLYGGWVAGWDTGFEIFDDGNMFIGGVSTSLNDNARLTYITTFGDSGSRGSGTYSHSVVLDIALTERLNYVAQSDLLLIEEGNEDDVGLNQYLFYDLTEKVRIGGRAEWWKNEGISFWQVTGGVNYSPIEKLRIRSEIRHDRGPVHYDQTTFGIDAILSY